MEKEWHRVPVDVVALMRISGDLKPLRILWADGRSYDVLQAGMPEHTRCRTGGYADRYEVRLGRSKRDLWREDGVWFVEVEGPEERAYDPRSGFIPC